VIRHQREEPRTDISDRLKTREGEFAEKVQSASDTVSETVAEVEGAVEDTVGTVEETVHETLGGVRSAFDIPHQVDRHPWLIFGGAVAPLPSFAARVVHVGAREAGQVVGHAGADHAAADDHDPGAGGQVRH